MNTLMGWLVTYLIHSTILLGLAWGLDRLLRGRPHWQEPVWKMALVGGLVTATVQTGAGLRPWGGTFSIGTEASTPVAMTGFAEVTSVAREVSIRPVEMVVRVEVPAGIAMDGCNGGHASDPEIFVWSAEPSPPAAGIALAGLGPVDPAPPRPLADPAIPTFWNWRAVVLGAWAAGALILLGALVRSWLLLRNRLRGRRPVHPSEIATTLGRLLSGPPEVALPRLSTSARVGVPIAMGILRPEICVPERVFYELSREAQESLFAHELGHLVRRDPLWRLVCAVIGRALYFQPLNWLAARKIDACAELLSDDWAAERTARPLSLAECLTAVARWTARPIHALPVAVAITGASDLRQRIERLVRGDGLGCRARLSRWAWPAAWCILAALTLLAPTACGVGEASSKRAAAPDRAGRTPPPALLAMADQADEDDNDSDDDDNGEPSCQRRREHDREKAKEERAKRKHDRAERHRHQHRYAYAYKYGHHEGDEDEEDDDDEADEDDDEPAPRGRHGKQGHPAPSLNLDLKIDLDRNLDEQLEKLQETLNKSIPSPEALEALLDKALADAGKGLENNKEAQEEIKKAIRDARRQLRKELTEARDEMKASLGKSMKEAKKARTKEMRELRERLPEIQRHAREAAEHAAEHAREQARQHAREHARRHAEHAREQVRRHAEQQARQEAQQEAQQQRQEAQQRRQEALQRRLEAQQREREARQREREAEIRDRVREKMKKKAKAHKHGHDDDDDDGGDIYDD